MSDKEHEEEHPLLGCVLMLIALLLAPGFILWRGYVLSIIWVWFMVPLGLLPIGGAHAMGISTLVALLTVHGIEASDETKEKKYTAHFINSVMLGILGPLASLGVAYVLHRFM